MLRSAIPLQVQGLVPSVWAYILQLGVGAAALGAYDTVSGATAPYFNCPTSVTGYVAVPFVFKATITNLLSTDPGAFFSSSTPSAIPVGVTLSTVDKSPYTYGNVYGQFSGKPTTQITNSVVNVTAGYSGQTPVPTNVAFTILPTPAPLASSTNFSAGDTVTVSITAGQPASSSLQFWQPLTYQWWQNASNKIASATNATLTLANAQATNAGSYTVVLTNTAGSYTSAPVVLSVNAGVAPSISTPPTNLTVTAGQPAAFTVAATGTAPLSYQWRKGGTPISGATGTNYTIANARAADAGSITVVITNVAGSITSAPAATLTVNAPPPPVAGAAVPQGGQFLFTFTPVAGLTNTVLTNSATAPAGWATLTNIPPPATASSITVTDAVSGPARFYRVQVVP